MEHMKYSDVSRGMKTMHDILLYIQYINIIIIFIESCLVFRNWKSSLHGWLFLGCIAMLLNAVGYLAEFNSYTQSAYITALRLSYLGRLWIVPFLLFFTTELCEKKLPLAIKLSFVSVHVIIYGFVFTFTEHDLFYKKYVFYRQGNFAHFAHTNGIVHIILTVLQFGYILYAFVLLFTALHKQKKTHAAKRRIIMMICSFLAQTLTYILQISGLFREITNVFDVTMIGYTVGNLFMFQAITRYDLLGTSEIAREVMIDRLSEGVIAVDRNGTVQYFNTPAKMLYPDLKIAEGNVPPEITEAIATHGTITINGRVYAPEENDLIRGKDNFGKLYALVDETEHFSYMQVLEEQKTIADSANHAKSVFLANMSHDIRTPINAVLGMNEMIQRECDDVQILDYSDKIKSAGTTLLGLINDILDLSKIEAGKLDIIPVDYDLTHMLNDLVCMIQPRADAKGLKLETNVDANIPKLLRGDEIRLKQIITNILTNAVKYTEKGTVTFSVGFEKSGEDSIVMTISVADTGIGIKQEDIPRLFSEFDRIEEERNRNIEGTGLGMSITQRLLAMMNSKLDVESEYGKGSVFSFAVTQNVVKWDAAGDLDEALHRSQTDRTGYHERFTAPGAEILVVDDTPMNLEVFVSLLKKTLVHIDTAGSGDECIALAKSKKYDIMFLDHMMPDKDGIETLGEIKTLKDCPNAATPMICLTANAVSGSREKYLNAGFDDYLTKPVEPERLEQMIMKYLPQEKLVKSVVQTRSAEVLSCVLVIDDDVVIRKAAESILSPYYKVICCGDEKNGLETAENEQPDLILLDINLFGASGFDVLKRLRENTRTCSIPVMIITGDSSEDTEVKGFRCGASDFIRKPFVPEVLIQRSKRVIDLYHYQSGLIREVGRQTERADRLSLEMMIALSKTVDAKDHYTNGHSGRVAEYAAEIARRMGKPLSEQEKIYEMGLMHDIGKIGVSEEIINKTSRLTDDEFAQIKKHTVIGCDILCSITEMPELSVGARSHHEKFNGTGYPDGLKGSEIPEAARIICVADCYDAMTSTRTYSTPRAQDAVRAEIERCSGTQFDPAIAAVMIKMIDDDTDYKMNEQGGAKVWKNLDKLRSTAKTRRSGAVPHSADDGTDAQESDVTLPDWLNDITEIDTASGLRHCGTAETYLGTLTTYAETVTAAADEAESLLKSGDIKNATVKIHALKSTSRVIGAMELGALAEELEAAGNAGDTDDLNERSGELFYRCRALGEKLSPLLETSEKPLIPEDELKEAYTLIREFLSVADYESVIQIIGGLKEYSYPDNEKERCTALIKAAAEFDYDAIAKAAE